MNATVTSGPIGSFWSLPMVDEGRVTRLLRSLDERVARLRVSVALIWR